MILRHVHKISKAKIMEDKNISAGSQSSCYAVDRDFTTEIFKIEIGNLPKCYSVCVSIVVGFVKCSYFYV